MAQQKYQHMLYILQHRLLSCVAQDAAVAKVHLRMCSTVQEQSDLSIDMWLQEADLLVSAAPRNAVPGCIVKAAAQNNLVCDGRLVVDAAFRTNDPKIFAAGTIAKFSRRSGMQEMSSYL